MKVDFLGLEAFLTIAERGSFGRAAAKLNLSQTALSHRMKRLEGDLGTKLLTRTTRQVSLTPAGTALLPRARELIDDLSTSLEDIQRQSREAQRQLAIGCLPTIAIHHLPPVLSEFSIAFPDVLVRILDNSANE